MKTTLSQNETKKKIIIFTIIEQTISTTTQLKLGAIANMTIKPKMLAYIA